MGHSYSSGEANPPFDSGTDVGGNTCHRSTAAWPQVLGRSNTSQLNLVAHIACSGTTKSALTGWFKGEAPQIDQLARTPGSDVITVTFGGNDLGFANIIAVCVALQCD
jgi:lysophospholipase L1-like esterase